MMIRNLQHQSLKKRTSLIATISTGLDETFSIAIKIVLPFGYWNMLHLYIISPFSLLVCLHYVKFCFVYSHLSTLYL
ncbi:hypothetical protein DsansV1_C25g0188461 [Dioscorea sansibarensis]